MSKTRFVAQAGVIAAVYATVTLIVLESPFGLGFGPVQLRLSEALVVVACLTPAGAPGLAIGSVIANSFMLAQAGMLGMFDVVFGSLATLLGALWSWRHRKRPALALAGPVVTNALIVPAYLPFVLFQVAGLDFYDYPVLGLSSDSGWIAMYLFGVCALGIGEAVVVYGLGMPLLRALKRLGIGATDAEGEEELRR